MSEERDIVSPVGRVIYPKLFTAEGFDESDPVEKHKFSVRLLFDKEDSDLSVITDAVKACAKAAKVPASALLKNAVIRDGDEKGGEAYEGQWFIDFKSSVRFKPRVVGPGGKGDVITEESERIFSGVYGRVAFKPYSYDYKGNKGVALGLNAFQLVKTGEELHVGGDSSDAFDEIELDDADLVDLLGE